MNIKRAGSIASTLGSKEWFTGSVRIDALFPADGGRHSTGAVVTFEPGARTHWHTHPAGQTIIITQGLAWVQREGSPVEEVRPGDIVFFKPQEKHWHGAAPQVGMVHIAITESREGKAVEWLEAVTDEQYRR